MKRGINMFGNEKYPQDHMAIIRATSGLYYIYVSNLDFSKVKFLHNNEVTNLKPADYDNLKLHDNVDWNKSLLSIRNEFQNMINPKVEYNSLDYEYYDEYPWSRSDALWIVNTVNSCILPFITLSKTTEYLIDCITND